MAEAQGLLSAANQVLTVAFFFGLLSQAALSSFLLFFRHHAKTIFKDGQRLVLVLFLLFGGLLWAQINFLALMIPRQIPVACQVIITFSTVFDQLARVAIEQFLLWKLQSGTKPSLIAFIMQGVLLIRLVAGGVHAGFSRPGFEPTCIAQTSLLPSSITVLSLEMIIVIFLVIRAVTAGVLGRLRRKGSELAKRQSKALILTIGAFILWTATSIIMILGLPGFMIILRLGGPANGLLILISIITIFADVLLSPMEEAKTTPEAQSPFVGPGTTTRDISTEVMGSGALSGNLRGNRSIRNTNQLFSISEAPRDSFIGRVSDQGMSNRGFVKLEDGNTDTPGLEQSTSIRQGAGNRGSSGIFGAIVAAPMINQRSQPYQSRAPRMDVDKAGTAQKKALFTWSRPMPKTSVRSLGISRPIMTVGEDPDDRPFTRMPTIDLATAAQNERERRQAAVGKASPLANNPVSTRQLRSLQQDLGRSMSSNVRPRELAKQAQGSAATNLLPPGPGAVSTSASLSPAREELRRRSPRDMSGFDFGLEEKPKTAPILSRGVSLGLPSNPRAQKSRDKNPFVPAAPTVMLMSNIVYENPGIVKTIIQDATSAQQALIRPKTADQSPVESYTTTLKSADSMIHRPRPYKRDSEKDRALFPAEPKTRHKRSRSLGSAFTSQSSTQSSYRSLFNALPALPVPRTAAELMKIFPNDTKSMTFDEKVQLLFPAPPRSAIFQHRRSSVPSVPRVPSEFLPESPRSHSPTSTSNRASRRTTIASFAKLSESSIQMPSPSVWQNKFPEARQIPDDQDISFKGSRIFGEWGERVPLDVAQSTSLQRSSVATAAISVGASDSDSSFSDWASIHSEIPQVNLKEARQNARSTFIKGPTKEVSDDMIPVMLDDGGAGYSSYVNSDRGSKQSFQDLSGELGDQKHIAAQPTFHHRIGDPLPTFSERESQTRTRKMPPPTPLLLSRITRKANIAIHATEPSPVPSPERAIEEIKAQLDRLEVSDRLSYASSQDTGNSQLRIQERFKMLENLEREMQEMEQLQNSLSRNNTSAYSSVANSPLPPPRVSLMSKMISKRNSQRRSRHSLNKEAVQNVSNGGELSQTPSSQSSDNSRASVWQKRLAEAQVMYLENAPSLLRNSFNFLAMPSLQAASPTPPESEESVTDIEDEAEVSDDDSTSFDSSVNNSTRDKTQLWKPAPYSPQAAFGRLWSYPKEKTGELTSITPPAHDIRPRPRLQLEPLLISSSGLWRKPMDFTNSAITQGLWGTKATRPTSTIARQRLSVKPKRRTRRMTVLPDIVESPVPVPNKRDTLGIFQFPWGETSDQPVYHPTFVPSIAFSSYATSSSMASRSFELEPEGGDYSSSFFDDYDDEDDSMDSETSSEDSEDEFDDNTLLEIADLLRSNEVPSRQSLFSPVTIVEDYSGGMDFESDSDVDEPRMSIAHPQIRLPIPPLDIPAKSPSLSPRGFMEYSEDLFISPEYEEDALITDPPVIVARTHIPEQPFSVTPYTGIFKKNNSLSNSEVEAVFPVVSQGQRALTFETSTIQADLLDTAKSVNSEKAAVTVQSDLVDCSMSTLWTQPKTQPKETSCGLFNIKAQSQHRNTDLAPAANWIAQKSRKFVSPLPKLESKSLWSSSQALSVELDWISVSSTRAISPSVYSPAPCSGGMTPMSEVDSVFDTASIRTTSTKASNLWESMSSSTPTWWEATSGSLSLRRNPLSFLPLSVDAKKPINSPTAPIAAREAELNSTIPKLRRQKSKEVCQETKEANDAARHLTTPETPRFRLSDMANDSDTPKVTSPPLPLITEKQDLFFADSSQVLEVYRDASMDATTPAESKTQSFVPSISKEAWINDLNKKAIIVGPAFARRTRPIVTEAEWVAALNEAVLAGQIDKPKRPAVSKEEWIEALEAAVRQGHGKKVPSKHLWSPPSSETASASTKLLWSKAVKENKSFVKDVSDVMTRRARRPLPAENLAYGLIESTRLWQSTMSASNEMNWLLARPSIKRMNTWTPRQSPTASSGEPTSGLWSGSSRTSTTAPTASSLTSTKIAPFRRASVASSHSLQRLESQKLFSRPIETTDSINWLQRTSASQVAAADVEMLRPMTATALEEPSTHALKDNPKGGWMLPLNDPRVSRSVANEDPAWI